MWRRCRPFVGILAGGICAISRASCEDISNVADMQNDADVGRKIAVISGTASRKMSKDICNVLRTPLTQADVARFSDGEISVEIQESMRGRDCFVVQTCAAPVNDNLMELLLTVTAARRSGVASVTAIIPYFPYKHNRKRHSLNTPYDTRFMWNSSADVAKMLETLGVDKVISVDLQRPGQGHEACFFDSNLPVETVTSVDLVVDYLLTELELSTRVVCIAANSLNMRKASKIQKKLQNARSNIVVDSGVYLSSGEGGDANFELLADVNGADVFVIDELVDTGKTMSTLCRVLAKQGAKRIFFVASHGLFTENSMSLIDLSPVERVIVTDTVELPANASNKIHQISIGPLLAKAVSSDFRGSIGKWDSEISNEEMYGGADDNETFELE